MKRNDPGYKRVESILYNYNLNKAKIKKLKRDLEILEHDYRGVGSNAESEVIKREKIKELEHIKMEIEKVNNALSILDDYEKTIIEMRYFDNYKNIELAAKLCLTEQRAIIIKHSAINKMSELL